ncbi:MAG: hypothetical protein R3F61_20205 [Myxococcota bacterium]
MRGEVVGTATQALEVIRVVFENSSRFRAKERGSGPTIRHDHGSQFMSRDYQEELVSCGDAFESVLRG